MQLKETHKMAITPHHTARGGREGGAIILTFSLMLLFLIGFAAIAVDIGRLFVVRTELQTALDSCALSAAQELDGQNTSITRATNAGLAAANLNRVNLQSPDWDGQAKLAAADLIFRDAAYEETTSPTAAQYAECRHTQANVKTVLLQSINAFAATDFATANEVHGSAVATRTHAQTTCPLPIGLRPKAGGMPPTYGYSKGEWVVLKGAGASPEPGQMGWYILEDTKRQSATVLDEEMSERAVCDVRLGRPLFEGTPGNKTALDAVWNQRFGIYKNMNKDRTDGPSVDHPDLTGYAYTDLNWGGQNAYDGPPPPGSSAKNYLDQRAAFAPFGSSVAEGAIALYGKNLLSNFHDVATSAEHARYGYSRRLVIVPVVGPSTTIADYACMLMLAPLTGGTDDTKLEFRGNAGDADSPCTTSGMAGGTAGPLVPVLVR
jgi:Flp pilus assembly protein TadG